MVSNSILEFAPDLTVVSTGDQDEGIEFYGKLKRSGLRYVIINHLTKEETVWPIRVDRLEAVKNGYLSADRVFFTCQNNHTVMEKRLKTEIVNWDIHFNPFDVDKTVVPEFPSMAAGIKVAVPAKINFIHKGQDLLVEAISSPRWKNRSLTINLYGEGPDKCQLEQMAKGLRSVKMVFHGRQADVSRIWIDNHAIVMPSRMEGLPIVLVGAMLSARVPIVTNVGGHSEVITDGVNGFLASNASAQSLEEALERAFQRRDEWETIGKRAREAILRHLPEDPVEDFVQKLLELTVDARRQNRSERKAPK